MDLSTLDTGNNQYEFRLQHPDGSDLPIWFTIRCVDSDAFQRALHENGRKQRDSMARSRRIQFSYEENRDSACELLASITVGWRTENGTTLDGKPFPDFSPATAKNLYIRWKWLREQVDAVMQERRNFLSASEKN